MSQYEISIQVKLTSFRGQPAGISPSPEPQNGDMILYGVLPNQAAVDEVMTRLYELGINLVLANLHSARASHFARELKPISCELNQVF
jgi:hypothetical protein